MGPGGKIVSHRVPIELSDGTSGSFGPWGGNSFTYGVNESFGWHVRALGTLGGNSFTRGANKALIVTFLGTYLNVYWEPHFVSVSSSVHQDTNSLILHKSSIKTKTRRHNYCNITFITAPPCVVSSSPEISSELYLM